MTSALDGWRIAVRQVGDKSPLRVLTLDRKFGPILGERYRLIATFVILAAQS